MVTRLLDSARGRGPHALVLLFLLAVPSPVAAQGSRWGPSLAPAGDLSLSPAERGFSKRSCPGYRLLPGESPDCEPWMAPADLTTDAPLWMAEADAQQPSVGEAPEPNLLLAALIPVTTWGLVAANSTVGGATYTHDVFAADLKLSGAGRRIGVNVWPLRWLLFSVTYGSKGYRVTPQIGARRQLGFEIGLNLQQIPNDVGVKRDTWRGYGLHLVGDNVRFPSSALGMRVDLDHGKWHGPNNGNFD